MVPRASIRPRTARRLEHLVGLDWLHVDDVSPNFAWFSLSPLSKTRTQLQKMKGKLYSGSHMAQRNRHKSTPRLQFPQTHNIE